MNWFFQLFRTKEPATMAEVESSYGNSPYENLRPPAWKSDASENGPVVPDVDSLARQVVALREEVARLKQGPVAARDAHIEQSLTDVRLECARYHAEWRAERDALSRRVERVDAFFPAGWTPGTTYHKYIGNVFVCVYPSTITANAGYNVSVSCVNDAGVGSTHDHNIVTLSEAMARGEQLAEELRVAMEDRTVVGGVAIKQREEMGGQVNVQSDVSDPKTCAPHGFSQSAFQGAAS